MTDTSRAHAHNHAVEDNHIQLDRFDPHIWQTGQKLERSESEMAWEEACARQRQLMNATCPGEGDFWQTEANWQEDDRVELELYHDMLIQAELDARQDEELHKKWLKHERALKRRRRTLRHLGLGTKDPESTEMQ
jgi:hypothetical protein